MRSSPQTPHPVHLGLSILILLLATVASWGASVTLSSFRSAGGYYLIENETDLRNLAAYVNGGGSTINCKFKQTADIHLEQTFTPIGYTGSLYSGSYHFDGTYDGFGYKISNLVVSNSNYYLAGLFGAVSGLATIQRVNLDAPSITSLGSAGGIAGQNAGTIYNCKVIGGSIQGSSAGGIAYSTDGTIERGKVDGVTITATSGVAGGIVSYASSYQTYSGKVLNSETRASTIKGSTAAGGIVGQISASTVKMEKNFAISTKINVSSRYGAIVGDFAIGQSGLSKNYYHKITINNSLKTTGIGVGKSPAADISGEAEPAFRVIINASNVSTSGAIAAESLDPEGSGNATYYAPNTTLSLNYSGTVSRGYMATYSMEGASAYYSGSKAYFTMPSQDVTIKSVSTASLATYTISYTLNGGSNPSSAPTSYTVSSGTVYLPTPTRTGYTFDGWYTNASFTGYSVSSFNPSLSSTTLENKQFYAKWAANTYYVRFDANGGKGTMSDQTFTYGQASTALKSNSFSSGTGYGSFIKWNTKADGSGTSYTDGQRVQNLTKIAGDVVILYAQWKKDIATNPKITISDIPDQTYTGSQIKPTIVIKDTTATITSNFTITYSNNTSIGQATVTITANSSSTYYCGSTTKTFEITSGTKDLSKSTSITVSEIPDQEWTGEEITPAVTVLDGATNINSELNIAYSDNIEIGEATVTITAKNTSTKYTGSTSTTFNIVAPKKDIATDANITISGLSEKLYTGSPIEPTITIMDGTTNITSEFNINYSNNTAIGKATVTIEAKSTSSKYKGSITKYFNIVETLSRTAPIAKELTYNGKLQELVIPGFNPDGRVLYRAFGTSTGSEYTEEIPAAMDAGTYTVSYIFENYSETNTFGEVEVTIKKATPNVIPPVAKDLSYTGENQDLITEGSTDIGYLQYKYKWSEAKYMLHFGDRVPYARNSGTYTVYYFIEETTNYYGIEEKIEVTIPGKCTQTAFLSINEVDGKKYAIIENSGNGDAFDLSTDIDVDNVKISRGFPVTEGNNYSTIMFPFEVSTENLSGVANIMEFARVGKNQTTGVAQVEVYQVWADTYKEHVTLTANKPYMIQMKSSKLEVSGPVTITSEKHNVVTKGKWSFVGTFKFKEWGGSNCDECGRVYGFAGYNVPSSGISTGQFVKFGEWVYIDPLRAYLRYDGSQQKNAPEPSVYAAPIASIEEELPESMDVVIVSREDEEKTTVIGTLDTRTGEIRMNRGTRTFDLKGRGISGKPKAKGVYLKK